MLSLPILHSYFIVSTFSTKSCFPIRMRGVRVRDQVEPCLCRCCEFGIAAACENGETEMLCIDTTVT